MDILKNVGFIVCFVYREANCRFAVGKPDLGWFSRLSRYSGLSNDRRVDGLNPTPTNPLFVLGHITLNFSQ